MLPSSFDVAADDMRTLVDLGFIALSAGLLRQAGTIFDGVVAARPEGEAGHIGLALVSLAQGRTEDAVRRLRARPPSDAVLTFLGMALARMGERDDARAALRAVVETPGGSPHAATAAALLAELA